MRGYTRNYYGIVVLNQAPNTAVLGRVVRITGTTGLQMGAISNVKMAGLLAKPSMQVVGEHATSTPAMRVFSTSDGTRLIHVEPLDTRHGSMVLAATDDFIVMFDDQQPATTLAPPVMLFWVALGVHNDTQIADAALVAARTETWPERETAQPDVLRHSQFSSMWYFMHSQRLDQSELVRNTDTYERVTGFFTARSGPPRTRPLAQEDQVAIQATFALPSDADPRNIGSSGAVPYFPPHLSPLGETYQLLRSSPEYWSTDVWARANYAPGNQEQMFEAFGGGFGDDDDDDAGDGESPAPLLLPTPSDVEPTVAPVPPVEPKVVWERRYEV